MIVSIIGVPLEVVRLESCLVQFEMAEYRLHWNGKSAPSPKSEYQQRQAIKSTEVFSFSKKLFEYIFVRTFR